MPEEIVEGAGKALLRGILWLFFRFMVEILFFSTGEFILYMVTFGRKKPRWDYYVNSSPTKFILLTEVSVWIGVAFWLLVAWFVNSKIQVI